MADPTLFTDPVLRGGVGLLLGLVVGSFVATLALRWPQGRSVAAGRSRCDGCDAALRPWELVPLLSHLAQRGRCRRCGQAIDSRHPIGEALGAAIGGASLALQPGWAGMAGAVFGWMLLALAMLDAVDLWLPDRLTLPLLGLGLAGGMAGLAPPAIDRLIGAAAGYALLEAVRHGYRALRRRDGLGGGDAKLFAAIGAWLGWHALPLVLLAASLIGLLVVVGLMLAGRRPTGSTHLPLGTFLAMAAWPVWLAGGTTW